MTTPDSVSTKSSWKQRIARALKPKSSSQIIRKDQDEEPQSGRSDVARVATNTSTKSRLLGKTMSAPPSSTQALSTQTGERRDYTTMLHSLTHTGSLDSLESQTGIVAVTPRVPFAKSPCGSLPRNIWLRIVAFLPVADAASLAFSTSKFRSLVGDSAWQELSLPSNRQSKLDFLLLIDSSLPEHVLCCSCVVFHRRTSPGDERLRPLQVINRVYDCPLLLTTAGAPPRARLTPGYALSFSLVQLAQRARSYSPAHGIPLGALNKRYACLEVSTWQHNLAFHFHKDHLLFRLTSSIFASPDLPPSAQRNLLYSREDYTPYFSVCPHWRDGVLMDVCKCVLSHIPVPARSITQQLRERPGFSTALAKTSGIVSLCAFCRLLRRCPCCPTEYLVEAKLVEDRSDKLARFKHAIVVTRWSDLGDGRRIDGPEWSALTGANAAYDSMATIGRRAISGVFESRNGDLIPGQGLLSLNPSNARRGEDGDEWY